MASSDEGEIRDQRAGDLKATSLSHAERNGVDRQDRQRNRHSSPDFDTASRYSNSSRRSRSPRGYKRSRDDRDRFPNARARDQDSRRGRGGRNDYRREEHKRPRVAYDDLDHPAPRGSNQGYDNDWRSRRDRERDRSRERHRSHRGRDRFSGRSPPRHRRSPSPRQYQRGDRRDGQQFVGEGYSDRHDSSRELRYDDADMSARDNNFAARKDSVGEANDAVKDDAKTQKDTTQNGDSAHAAATRWVMLSLLSSFLFPILLFSRSLVILK